MRVTVAVAQAEVAPDLGSALERTEQLTAEARRAGATLVAFPETWIPGYPVWLDVCRDAALWDHPPVKEAWAHMARESLVIPGPAVDTLAGIARTHEVTLVLGATERVDGGPARGTLYNVLLTFGPDGTLRNHHRKLVPTYTEKMVWGHGDGAGLRAVETPAGRVGGLICWEHWMPLARQAMHQSGEDIHVAVWPNVHDLLQVASRSYAFEGRCFVLAAGSLMRAKDLPAGLEPHPDRVTGPEQWVLRGGSAIIGPDGRYLAGPVYDEPAMLVAELDLEACRRESMALDVTGHYHRKDVFTFEVSGER